MNTINVDGDRIDFSKVMKWNQFVQDVNGYVRKFTFVTIKNNEIYIGHKIPNMNTSLTKIEFEDLTEWIKYFDRI